MPADLQKVSETKDKIMSLIKTKGPSLPVQIASAVNMSPLFTSAFLSEIYAEKKIKLSHMRVGSSPLYYIQGQEAMLDNFVQFLNHKEREAFYLLKEKKLLEDSRLLPAIRVAIKDIKDFAIPLKIRIGDEVKLFWKYHQTPDEEVKQIINPFAHIAPAPAQLPIQAPAIQQIKKEEQIQAVLTPQSIPAPSLQTAMPEPAQVSAALEISSAPKKKAKPIESDFIKNIREHLSAKDIEILETLIEKKKEFYAKVRIDTMFGKQEYYLIAKDKKTVNESDLSTALQKAQTEKMPALFMCKGELHKKAQPYLKDWKNLVKFEKLNF